MEFVFQGFQSSIPVWIYLLLIIATTALSWWSYSRVAIRPLYKYGLIFIRSLVFFILLALLINPFYKAERTYLEKPEIMVLLDNSASTSIQKGEYQGETSYRNLIDKLDLRDSSRVKYRMFAIGESIHPASPDSLTFDKPGTNLYNAIEAVRNSERDIKGAILISDGIFNRGRNPVFEAGNVTVPIMTVALGDTLQQQDLIVEEVITNDTGYLNTVHPVEVKVSTYGFSGQNFQVRLMKEDEILQSRTVSSDDARSSHALNFEIDLKQEGLQQYTIVIPALESEWTSTNNRQPFAVDVIDEKQRVLSLAFEIHPDVGFMRSELLKNKNIELSSRTWLGTNRFMEGPLTISADTLDLIVLHGFPRNGLPAGLQQKVSSLLANKPLLLAATPLGNFNRLEEITAISLPVSFSENTEIEQVSLIPDVEPSAHPVMELPEINYSRLPSLSAPTQDYRIAPGTTVLFVSSYQGLSTRQPLIAIQEIGNIRRSQLSGYGWYRLAQSTNGQIRTFTRQLFSNIVSWSAAKPDNRKLKIQPFKKVFTGDEPIVLNAFLTNESGEKESDGVIDLTLSGEDIETRFYSLDNLGGGQYQLKINSLPEGMYNFSATAQKGNRTIDVQKGEFSVSNTNIEFVHTNRNETLLKQISQRSGGSYFAFSNVAGFTDSLKKKGMLEREENVSSTLFYPYQHAFWFVLVIALLTAEWVARKYLTLT